MTPSVVPGFLVIAAFVLCSVASEDPCTTIKPIPNIDKRDGKYQIATGESYINDRFLTAGWYGPSDSRTLLNSAPGFQKCGTLFPIWRKSSRNGESDMCIQTFDDECYLPFTIKTKMCGTKEIYELKQSTLYRSAYCFGFDEDTPPVFTEKPTVEIELVHTGSFTSELKFSCKFNKHQEDVFYSTNWLVDNELVITTKPELWSGGNIIKNQALTETQLKNANVKRYGIQVSCSVRASYGIGKPASSPVSSDWKFVGIKVSPTSVVLSEGESTDVSIQLTAPFGCGSLASLVGLDCRIFVAVNTVDDPLACHQAVLVRTSCGVEIDASSWNVPVSLKVFGKITSMYGSLSTVNNLKLTTSINPFHEMWSNYDLGLIKVQLEKNTSLIERKSCYSINDPHMSTFDGRRYEHHYGGVFTMYKHNELPIEVQIQTTSCGRAFCNCGVAVRAGRTVFEFNRCEGQTDIWTLEYTLCDDGGNVLQVKRKGSNYEVFLPTGGKVKVTVSSRYLNVYIYPSVKDVRNSGGLCGYLSGVCTDDFVLRDGGYSTDPTSTDDCKTAYKVWENVLKQFSASWRVQNGNNLFDYKDHSSLTKWPTQSTFCVCPSSNGPSSPEVECTADKAFETCQTLNGFTNVHPTKCSISERRSMARGNGGNRGNNGISAGKVPAKGSWRNGWTRERSRQYCALLFKKSQSVQVCEKVAGVDTKGSIDNCMADIWWTGTTMFDHNSLDTVRSNCLHEIVVNPELKAISQRIVTQACTNDCSGKGTCIAGNCTCVKGYGGDDCSINITAPITLTEVENEGYCDTSRYSCRKISVHGEMFADDAICSITGFKVTQSGKIHQGWKTSRADVQSISKAQCRITTYSRNPFAKYEASHEDYVWGFFITVSNDGKSHSNRVGLMVYDGTCISAHIVNATDFSWTVKGSYCVHDGTCFEHGAINPDQPCKVCDGTSNSWQRTERSCILRGEGRRSGSA